MKSKRTISPKTIAMLDEAAANFIREKVSPPVSLKEHLLRVPEARSEGLLDLYALKRKKRKG